MQDIDFHISSTYVRTYSGRESRFSEKRFFSPSLPPERVIAGEDSDVLTKIVSWTSSPPDICAALLVAEVDEQGFEGFIRATSLALLTSGPDGNQRVHACGS